MTTEHRPGGRGRQESLDIGNAAQLPGLIKAALSLAIVFHMLAVGALVLAAGSGPWWVRSLGSSSPSQGPMFAGGVAHYTTAYYLQPLGLANDFHFESNMTDLPSIYLEAVVDGKKMARIPDPNANMWVRYRQRMVANCMGNDSPFQARMGQPISPDGQTMPKVAFFFQPHFAVKQKLLNIKDVPKDTQDDFVKLLATVLNQDELDRYKEEILREVNGERFRIAGTLPGFPREPKDPKNSKEPLAIKAEDPAALNDWLEKQAAHPPIDFDGKRVDVKWYKIPYMLIDRGSKTFAGVDMFESVRSKEKDDSLARLYEEDEHQMPKIQVPVFVPTPGATILARSMARYFARQHGEHVELVRVNRNPLAPLLMFPSPEAPGKLFIDAPPREYNLDTIYTNFGNGQPRKWLPR